MATDKEPKLKLQVLCSDCRSPLTTSASKLGDHAAEDIEVLVDQCADCRPTTVESIELILNGSERLEVAVDYEQ